MKFILSSILLLLISACVSTTLTGSDEYLQSIPAGSLLILKQPLIVPQGKSRTGIQYGIANTGINPNEPYCEFLIDPIAGTTTAIPAGKYRVTKNRGYQIPYAINYNLNMTALRLESDMYSNIRQVECGIVSWDYETRYLTITDFETLAGDIMKLEAAEK